MDLFIAVCNMTVETSAAARLMLTALYRCANDEVLRPSSDCTIQEVGNGGVLVFNHGDVCQPPTVISTELKKVVYLDCKLSCLATVELSLHMVPTFLSCDP